MISSSFRTAFATALLTAGVALASVFLYAQDLASGQALAEPAGSRVGRTFWARPGLSDTSVEFYKEPELRSRAPVYGKARFEVLAVAAPRPFPEPEPIYRVRFDGGEGEPTLESATPVSDAGASHGCPAPHFASWPHRRPMAAVPSLPARHGPDGRDAPGDGPDRG